MKRFLASLVSTVVLAAVCGSADPGSRSHISNWSTRQIRASTSYWPGTSHFKDRLIEPYTTDVDTYLFAVLFVDIEIWIEGSPTHGWVSVAADHSIVAFDDGSAVDIYEASHGTLIQKWRAKRTTIYPW